MKKIFAIALALVMVFSMASAFALNNCSANFAWPCDPDVMFCGRGSVELVPVVRVNNACGGSDFQINTCAGAVAGEYIYYAVKLNVEANPDAESNEVTDKEQEMYWWDATWTVRDDVKNDPAETAVVLTFSQTEDDSAVTIPVNSGSTGIDWDASKAKSYYLVNEDSGTSIEDDWIDVTDEDLDFDDVVFWAKLADNANASKAKVCAELFSYNDGVGTWHYGDYEVTVASNYLKVAKSDTNYVEYTITGDNESVYVAGDKAIQAEVNKLFNLNGCTIGTCLTDKNIQKNFGWDTDGKLKNCFSWSAKAAAIVDAECVVAIPKTGDVSVVAYAVMAIAAAAGMLKK